VPYDLSVFLSVCLSVSVWKVYCGKTADCVWMLFGMVSGVAVGLGVGVLDGDGDHRKGRGNF